MIVALAACAAERELPDGGDTGVHPSGILDEASENFHGRDLARHGYDLRLCASCHGDDFAGGAAKATCLKCHPAGPDACETCHRDGEMSGAHAVHGAVGLDCAECHVKPDRWDAPGHVLDDPAPAELTFGARAQTTLVAADRLGPPRYEGGRCDNVYCHGDVLHAGGGSQIRPRWDDPTPPGGCTTCHAAPPPSHAQDGCPTCHREAPHLDGVLQIGGGCADCHGDQASAAPPRDLAGNLLTTAIGVGAHRAHLDAPSHLSAPIACDECHVVPATRDAIGHLDSALPAEVFPDGSGDLARRDGAVPTWDRATASCASTYCHGSATPVWTGGGPVACGSCHDVPPADHDPGLTITDCATCHPRSVAPSGSVLPDGEHLDGDVDVF